MKKSVVKSAYTKPVLTLFGSVAGLTGTKSAGGSGDGATMMVGT